MREKLSMSRKVGYGFGMFGESIAMNMFLVYFLFFLTDVVGMDPALSGTIVTVCAFWGAFTDLAAGAKSDASRNPKGKRGPFIFKSAILLGIAIFLVYSDWDFIPDNMKPVYFVAALLIYYFSLSFTDMPYQSLGSEITENAGERVQLRSIANVLNYVGMILASSGTLVLVTMFMNGGSSYSGAWSKVGLLFGVLTVIAYWLSVLAAKGKEPIPSEDEQVEKFSLVNIFKNYIEVMKLKAYRPFLLYTIFVYAGITLFTCMYVYYLNNNMGYTSAQTSTVMLIYSIMVIILSAIFGCFRWDAKLVITASMILSGAALCIFHFVTPGTFGLYFIFFMFAIAISAFFVQSYAVVYEVCDIDTNEVLLSGECVIGKNSFKNLSRFELSLWLFSCAAIVLSQIFSGSADMLTAGASLIGVTALIFVAKGDVLGQLLTVVFSLAYAVISFAFKYYG